MSSSAHKVTVIVPNWNGARWLPDCLGSLAAQDFRAFATLLVDNGSSDESVAYCRRSHPGVRVLCLPSNRGFAAAVNAGLASCRTPYVALLNTDTRPAPAWLGRLVEAMDRFPRQIACAASRMLRMQAPGIIDDAGDILSWYGSATKRGHGEPAQAYGSECDVFAPCAGAALYRRSVLEELGGFDERFFAYLEDIDLGLRAQLRGYRCRYVPGADVLHHGHGSEMPRGRYVRLVTRNRLMLLAKNIPCPLLIKHAGRILCGQAYFFLAYRRPLDSLAGYLSFLPQLPHVVRERRVSLRTRRISNRALDRVLARGREELRDPRAATHAPGDTG
jgi:GT2 family glycosyltransferase